MHTFLELIIKFYHIIHGEIGLTAANEVTTEWIQGLYGNGANGFIFLLVGMVLLNIIHRPSKYKFRLFFAPKWTQVLMRNIVFFNIMMSPVLFVGLVVIFVGLLIFHFNTMSRFRLSPGSMNPFSSFFS